MFLAIGGWDDKVGTDLGLHILILILSKIHILDSLSWSEVFTLELSTRIGSTVVCPY